MALKRLVTACLAFISVICIAGCSFFDDVVHLKNDNEAILASDQNRMLLQALAEEYNASQSKYKVWLAEAARYLFAGIQQAGKFGAAE